MSEFDSKEAVRKTAAVLDAELAPGWREIIDLDALDMAIPYACVAGQLGGGEAGSYSRFMVAHPDAFGFGAFGMDDDGSLDPAWREELSRVEAEHGS